MKTPENDRKIERFLYKCIFSKTKNDKKGTLVADASVSAVFYTFFITYDSQQETS